MAGRRKMEQHTRKLRDGRALVLREADSADARALLDYIEAVSGESNFLTFGPGEFELTEEQDADLLRRDSGAGGRLYLVALIDEEIVGSLTFAAGERSRLRHRGEFGMSVRKHAWRSGIGSALVDTLIDWARDEGIVKKIVLQVRTDNQAGVGLYLRKGFVIEGTMRNEMFIDGTYYDLHWMGREL